jgi:hypothetical protein
MLELRRVLSVMAESFVTFAPKVSYYLFAVKSDVKVATLRAKD